MDKFGNKTKKVKNNIPYVIKMYTATQERNADELS